MKIGFIGLGHMGRPMAENLLKAGYSLSVYDVVSDAEKSLVELGAISCHSLVDVVNAVDCVITMIQTGEQVKEVCLSQQGIFKHLKRGALYIDCSSIDIEVSRELHAIAKEHHIAMLDAPVSGGVLGAQNKTLTFMVGGEASNYERALPLLQNMGKKIIHAGAAGNGQAAKICNNLLLGISMVGVSEAFSLAEKLGLSSSKFFEISSNSSGQCWAMTSYCPAPGVLENVPSSHDYEPGFMAKMMLKDLHLAQTAASLSHAYTPLGALTTGLYEEYVKSGYGEKDFSAIIQMISDRKQN